MRYRYTATALREIDELFAFISKTNPAAARAVVDRIEQAIERLVHFPYMAQKIDMADVRRFPVRASPFIIYYTVEGGDVVILHVRHSARRPPSFP
jgi:addiction module RelE/StbE family toxin